MAQVLRLLLISSLLFSSIACADKHIKLNINNTVNFRGEVTGESVNQVMKQLHVTCELNKHKPIYLVLDSPGGSVFDGITFINFAKSLPCEIHTITITAISMAFVISQHLGKRYVLHNGTYMSHRAAVKGIGGQFDGEMESRINWMKVLLFLLDKKIADRIGLSIDKYKQLIINEWWLVGNDAVKANVADEVVTIVCTKELIETGYRDSNTGSILSLCPLLPYAQ